MHTQTHIFKVTAFALAQWSTTSVRITWGQILSSTQDVLSHDTREGDPAPGLSVGGNLLNPPNYYWPQASRHLGVPAFYIGKIRLVSNTAPREHQNQQEPTLGSFSSSGTQATAARLPPLHAHWALLYMFNFCMQKPCQHEPSKCPPWSFLLYLLPICFIPIIQKSSWEPLSAAWKKQCSVSSSPT